MSEADQYIVLDGWQKDLRLFYLAAANLPSDKDVFMDVIQHAIYSARQAGVLVGV